MTAGDWQPGEEERTRRILAFIDAKWSGGCLVCGGHEFGVEEPHALPFIQDIMKATGVVPVICTNCGYVMLFATRLLPDEGR